MIHPRSCNAKVALRKESVDRNALLVNGDAPSSSSLSARRAWIEIIFPPVDTSSVNVALRKESVDRNIVRRNGKLILISRSPQGERG